MAAFGHMMRMRAKREALVAQGLCPYCSQLNDRAPLLKSCSACFKRSKNNKKGRDAEIKEYRLDLRNWRRERKG